MVRMKPLDSKISFFQTSSEAKDHEITRYKQNPSGKTHDFAARNVFYYSMKHFHRGTGVIKRHSEEFKNLTGFLSGKAVNKIFMYLNFTFGLIPLKIWGVGGSGAVVAGGEHTS